MMMDTAVDVEVEAEVDTIGINYSLLFFSLSFRLALYLLNAKFGSDGHKLTCFSLEQIGF
jgi:hypothetical protein